MSHHAHNNQSLQSIPIPPVHFILRPEKESLKDHSTESSHSMKYRPGQPVRYSQYNFTINFKNDEHEERQLPQQGGIITYSPGISFKICILLAMLCLAWSSKAYRVTPESNGLLFKNPSLELAGYSFTNQVSTPIVVLPHQISTKECGTEHKLYGIVGGIGPAADIRLQQLILEKDQSRHEKVVLGHQTLDGFLADADYTPYLLYHNPAIPNNNLAILGRGPPSLGALLESSLALKRAGANEIIFCCTTAYHWKKAVEEFVPVFDLLDLVAEKAAAGGLDRVGLLDVDGTIQSGIFQQALSRRGVQMVIPDEIDQQKVMSAVASIKAHGVTESDGAVKALESVARTMARQKEVTTIILGCTEIALALGKSSSNHHFHPEIPKYIDILEILAEFIVDHRIIGGR